MLRRIAILASLGALALCATAYQSQMRQELVQQPPDIQEEVAERIAERLAEKQRECRDELINQAIARTDSFLMQNAQRLLGVDTMGRPIRPVKPVKPPTRPPGDTVPPVPILPPDSF